TAPPPRARAIKRSKPARRPAPTAALCPSSVSMISTCAKPSARARSAKSYCKRWLSMWRCTWRSEDWRRYTIALRCRCRGVILGCGYRVFIGRRTSGLRDCDNGGGHLRDELTLQISRQGDGRSDRRLRWKPEVELQLLHEYLLAEGLSLLPGGKPRSHREAPGK